ncbi:phytase-domain-containing protein [Phlyctochytrium arcticum]|nr:phytase-domain-containing protein [Phlyctochytrium arcticum]
MWNLGPFLVCATLASSFLAQAVTAAPRPADSKIGTSPITPYPIIPKLETGPAGTDGDDPAIWVHPTNREKSLIITTSKKDKDGALNVWNVDGKLLQNVKAGKPNNVDIIYDFKFGGEKIDLVVAGCRENNTMCMWKIDSEGKLCAIPGGDQPTEPGYQVYGSCEYRSRKTQKQYVFVNSKTSQYLQYELYEENGGLKTELVRKLQGGQGGQVEGCVADKDNGWLFIGEEEKGLWRHDAEPDGSTKGVLVDKVDSKSGGHMVADVEGVSLFYGKDKKEGYLIVSIQGASAYNVYERKEPHKYLYSFNLPGGSGIDEVTETDGLAVVSSGLGSRWPEGLLVVHDDHKTDMKNKTLPETTFKFVDFRDIANNPITKLTTFPAFDPRSVAPPAITSPASTRTKQAQTTVSPTPATLTRLTE